MFDRSLSFLTLVIRPFIPTMLVALLFLPAILTAQDPLEATDPEALSDERAHLEAAYRQASERVAGEVGTDRETAREQGAAMSALELLVLQDFGGKLSKLETQLTVMERNLQQSRATANSIRALDSTRQALALLTAQANYLDGLREVDRLYAATVSGKEIRRWRQALEEARELANPLSYQGFSSGLAKLEEEQKNGLRLPKMDMLTSPETAQFYALSTVLGAKGEAEEIKQVRELACVLDFARRAERQIDYMATEIAFAEVSAKDLHLRAAALRDKLYDVTNLKPGELGAPQLSFVDQQFTPKFLDQHRATLGKLLGELADLQADTDFHTRSIDQARKKSDFALERMAPACGEDLEDTTEMLTERHAELVDAHRGGNG
jgi:hypothetical protein